MFNFFFKYFKNQSYWLYFKNKERNQKRKPLFSYMKKTYRASPGKEVPRNRFVSKIRMHILKLRREKEI